MNSQTSDKQAVLLGSGAVVLWSTVATVFNLSLDFVSPLTLVTLASVTSWFFLGTILVVSGEMRTLNQIKASEWARLLALGLINPTLYYFLLFGAYAKLPAQEAMAINYTWGLVLPLLAAPLLGQALKGRDIVYALVSYCGVFVIATRGEVLTFELSDPTGVGLAIGSTLLWALYWIGNTRISTPPVQGLFVGFTSATAILLTLSLFTGSLLNLPWQALAGGLYIGFFEMGLSFILWLKAMKLTRNTAQISTLIFLSP
ncbi:MAG: DMT family transporter, partial [Halieaceae bacterium]|nr:DMT family transporter [Halieaceae bacterium]